MTATQSGLLGEHAGLNVERAVRERYSQAAEAREENLCCAVEYDPRYLEVIPPEILERDYGCGDPSKYVALGETVLDLGSGGGKICYIASQIVGPQGRVIGVDCNETMLALAKKYRESVGNQLGYHNVEFRKGKIQDLKLDLELVDEQLARQPIQTSQDWLRIHEQLQQLREASPMIGERTIDVVISNCVLNLVDLADRRQLFGEMYRVLKNGGRACISDIVCDEDVPEHLMRNAKLWSGCLSGAFREDRFLEEFEHAGFYGVEVLSRQESPWAIIEGIEFRSVTVRAFKGKEGPCKERRQAVIYKGPWKAVIDDDGHKLLRGQRMAVCDKTFQIYSRMPYSDQIAPVSPAIDIPLAEAADFDCRGSATRSPQETKHGTPRTTQLPEENCCGPEGCC
ncbi:MAG: methyltransferase domain-containing protein [Planctomycetaceae bacterium]